MSHPENAASDIQGAGSVHEPVEAPSKRTNAYERVPVPQGPVAGLGSVPSDPGRTDGRKKDV